MERTLKEIRAIIRKIAKNHSKYKACRLLQFNKDTETGVLSLQDIAEFSGLESINKSYPYGGHLDRYVYMYAGTLMSIEVVEKDDC